MSFRPTNRYERHIEYLDAVFGAWERSPTLTRVDLQAAKHLLKFFYVTMDEDKADEWVKVYVTITAELAVTVQPPYIEEGVRDIFTGGIFSNGTLALKHIKNFIASDYGPRKEQRFTIVLRYS